jgi:hypothetical protein
MSGEGERAGSEGYIVSSFSLFPLERSTVWPGLNASADRSTLGPCSTGPSILTGCYVPRRRGRAVQSRCPRLSGE